MRDRLELLHHRLLLRGAPQRRVGGHIPRQVANEPRGLHRSVVRKHNVLAVLHALRARKEALQPGAERCRVEVHRALVGRDPVGDLLAHLRQRLHLRLDPVHLDPLGRVVVVDPSEDYEEGVGLVREVLGRGSQEGKG